MRIHNERHLNQTRDFMRQIQFEWNNDEKPEFVEILTRRGIKFTFNIERAEDIVKLDK